MGGNVKSNSTLRPHVSVGTGYNKSRTLNANDVGCTLRFTVTSCRRRITSPFVTQYRCDVRDTCDLSVGASAAAADGTSKTDRRRHETAAAKGRGPPCPSSDDRATAMKKKEGEAVGEGRSHPTDLPDHGRSCPCPVLVGGGAGGRPTNEVFMRGRRDVPHVAAAAVEDYKEENGMGSAGGGRHRRPFPRLTSGFLDSFGRR
jgi:hypothetical protein